MAWIYKRPDSECWWIGYRVNGKQVLRSTKEKTEEGARRVLAQVDAMFGNHRAGILDQVYSALSGNQTKDRPLLSAKVEWLKDCEINGASSATLERYRAIVNRFAEACGATEQKPTLAGLSKEHVRQFLNDRRTLSGGTRRLEKKVLSVFFEFCRVNEWMQDNPVLRLPKAKAKASQDATRRPFTLEELKLLYSKAPDDFWGYMILAGFTTGQRMGDLVTLRWENVDLAAGMIHLKQRKTGKTVHLPISSKLRSVLLSVQNLSKRSTGPIWPEQAALYTQRGAGAFSPKFYDILAACGLAKARDNKAHKAGRSAARAVNEVSFHCLRHTFVSLLKITGATQSTAKELAGHSSDLVSDQYTHLPESVLRQAVEKLPAIDV